MINRKAVMFWINYGLHKYYVSVTQTSNIKQLRKLYDRRLCRERLQKNVTMIAFHYSESFENIFEYKRIKNSNNLEIILQHIIPL